MKTQHEEHLRTAIEHMLNDQGLSVEEADGVKLPRRFDDNSRIDWIRVNNFLGTLSDEDLETFCVGDQDDMVAIAQRGDELGEYAYRAMDALFETIGC